MPSRMISHHICESDKIANLSPKSLALFCLLIPNFNAHGKMQAEPSTIKGTVCPKIAWLENGEIEKCLSEISNKTNVKWFKFKGLWFLHSLNWKEHQKGLKGLGKDELPDYLETQLPEHSMDTPGTLHGYSPPEVGGGGGEGVGGKGKGGVGGGGSEKNKLSPLSNLWNVICMSLPVVTKITKSRKEKEACRLKEHPSIEFWNNIFKKIESTPFLKGQNNRNWKADFDWIVGNDSNVIKVLEGRYDNSNQSLKGHNETIQNLKELYPEEHDQR